ncbi:DUF4374 domain-containing protein [Myroides pelagicus]|uniref:DUF4374 domain-containing protein n=1 Tax=Myroides pelagicus TaxID=270914 RepID=A0A7K1GQD8_9FLAO|nr:DUF4374 domain-containing protein [Myroides pelagicus]MEC4115186.1 DUF4374 domain-containing protein [Myroides pelagicus]MTH30950.1 DUF4374 domain-containing protein [Myroides pelagicus]
MKKRVLSIFAFAMLFGSFGIMSCSSDDSTVNNDTDTNTDTEPNTEWKYVIGASVSKTKLLFTTQDLKQGKLSAKGNGVQSIGTKVFNFGLNRLYVFEYRKGDPSGMQSWLLNANGELEEKLTVDLPNREEFIADFGKYMVATTGGVTTKDGKRAQAFNFVNGDEGFVEFTSLVPVENIVEQGEYANFAGLEPIGDNRFVMAVEPFKIVQNKDEDNTSTFRNRVWLVVFKLDEATKQVSVEKIVKDDRMSFAVGRRRSGRLNAIGKDSQGDIYAFSPSAMINRSGETFSQKPSSVLKLNKNTLTFDKDYYYNLEELSGGHKVLRVYSLNNDYFVLDMRANTNEAWNMAPANKLALFNARTGEFTWIKGLPAVQDIASAGEPFVEGNDIFIPVTAESKSFVYTLDLPTATVKKGLEITDLADGSIGTIGKISSK